MDRIGNCYIDQGDLVSARQMSDTGCHMWILTYVYMYVNKELSESVKTMTLDRRL